MFTLGVYPQLSRSCHWPVLFEHQVEAENSHSFLRGLASAPINIGHSTG